MEYLKPIWIVWQSNHSFLVSGPIVSSLLLKTSNKFVFQFLIKRSHLSF